MRCARQREDDNLSLKHSLEKAEDDRNGLKDSLNKASVENLSLRDSLEKAKDAMLALKDDLKMVQDDNRALQGAIAHIAEENEGLRGALIEEMVDNQVLSEILEENQVDLYLLEEQNDSLMSERQDLMRMVAHLEETIAKKATLRDADPTDDLLTRLDTLKQQSMGICEDSEEEQFDEETEEEEEFFDLQNDSEDDEDGNRLRRIRRDNFTIPSWAEPENLHEALRHPESRCSKRVWKAIQSRMWKLPEDWEYQVLGSHSERVSEDYKQRQRERQEASKQKYKSKIAPYFPSRFSPKRGGMLQAVRVHS